MSMYDRDWYREKVREEREQAQRQVRTQTQERAGNNGGLAIICCPIVTIAAIYLSLQIAAGGPTSSIIGAALLPMIATAINLIAFVDVGRKRANGNKGIVSALALVVSMLGCAFSFVLSFMLVYMQLVA